jgi:hypothetical protein
MVHEDFGALKRAIDCGDLQSSEWLREDVNTFVPDELKGLSDEVCRALIIEKLGEDDGYDRRFREQYDEWLAERGESE